MSSLSTIDHWQLNEYTHMKPGLERINRFLEKIGNPQNSFKQVLIAGTNGKGSTAKMLASILESSGLKTGLYTSPHLVHLNERICVNSKQISNSDLKVLADRYLPLAKKLNLSFFEFITGIALEYFRIKKADIAVLEVGLGGKFDAVNACQPVLSIITDIDYDHTKILGNTLKQIASEKAGIIRKNKITVSGIKNKDAVKVVRKSAGRLFEYGKDFKSRNISVDWNKQIQSFEYTGLNKKIKLKFRLLGAYQVRNASVAVTAALSLGVNEKSIKKGLKAASWPGRFSLIKIKNRVLILDGAHNPGAVKVFKETFLKSPWLKRKKTFIFGVLEDKDYKKIINILSPLVSDIILVPVKSKRSLAISKLKECWLKYLKEQNIQTAGSFKEALTKAKEKIVICTGSLYLVGEALKNL